MKIERNLFPVLEAELKRKEVTILLGPRQVGKTYLMRWLKGRMGQGKNQSTYFNLEDPHHLRLFNEPIEKIVRRLTRSGRVIFMDEFHYLKNASQLFKVIYDQYPRIKIFASGSSSIEIHKHLRESLAGRRRIIKVPPLSFSEIHRKFKSQAKTAYFQYGGLPGVWNEKSQKNKMALLDDLLQAYILKDIRSLIKEENIRAFNSLLYLIAQNQGFVVSVDRLANDIGLTPRTTQKYLDIMSHTYVLAVLPSYSRNLGNELRKSKKYYLYDLGIRNALLKDFRNSPGREDRGAIYESAVFLDLLRNLGVNEDLRFWRTRDGQEVDFIFLRNRQPTPIEVKTTWNKTEVPAGMKSFLFRYPDTKKAFVINQSFSGKTRYKKTEIIFQKWPGEKDLACVVE